MGSLKGGRIVGQMPPSIEKYGTKLLLRELMLTGLSGGCGIRKSGSGSVRFK